MVPMPSIGRKGNRGIRIPREGGTRAFLRARNHDRTCASATEMVPFWKRRKGRGRNPPVPLRRPSFENGREGRRFRSRARTQRSERFHLSMRPSSLESMREHCVQGKKDRRRTRSALSIRAGAFRAPCFGRETFVRFPEGFATKASGVETTSFDSFDPIRVQIASRSDRKRDLKMLRSHHLSETLPLAVESTRARQPSSDSSEDHSWTTSSSSFAGKDVAISRSRSKSNERSSVERSKVKIFAVRVCSCVDSEQRSRSQTNVVVRRCSSACRLLT